MSTITLVLSILLVFAGVAIAYLLLTLRTLRSRFGVIVDAEAEANQLKEEAAKDLERLKADANRLKSQTAQDLERLKADASSRVEGIKAETARLQQEHVTLAENYEKAKSIYDRLSHEVSLVEENLEDISFGLYKPHFAYDTPEQYKEALENVCKQQKVLIRSNMAANFAIAWTVGGSRKDGERMQKQYAKLLLRAFNGECDASIAKVSWNNVTKMEERILKAIEAINELGSVMQVSITPPYLQLKINELRLEFELEEKKHAIAEEQRRIREQMREEERAQRELERAQEEAQVDESRFQKALDKAKVELAKSRGEEHRRLTERLIELEQQLQEAHMKKERVKAMAELTRAGYVYIISNIGSFGETVFKIGMTRRLDPFDRVKELGDASVPFPFDVHAMVYSENAPALECDIQTRFADRCINLVNTKKEFFNVTIDELDNYAKEKGLSMHFTRLAEAREFRETLAAKAVATKQPAAVQRASLFPESLSN